MMRGDRVGTAVNHTVQVRRDVDTGEWFAAIQLPRGRYERLSRNGSLFLARREARRYRQKMVALFLSTRKPAMVENRQAIPNGERTDDRQA